MLLIIKEKNWPLTMNKATTPWRTWEIFFSLDGHINWWQTLCDKHDNNSFWKQFPPNFTVHLKDLFVKDRSTVTLLVIKHHNKGICIKPVTFVTHKRFALLLHKLAIIIIIRTVLLKQLQNIPPATTWNIPLSTVLTVRHFQHLPAPPPTPPPPQNMNHCTV